jgi:hypothetical protein
VFFRLRERGETFALVVSTFLVFFATWALHSYQWFWLLGSVLLSWPDALFWGILAVLLVVNSVRENRRGRRRSLGAPLPTVRMSLRHGLAVTGTFTTMCVLWSLWTSHTLQDWFGLLRNSGLGGRELAAAGLVLSAATLLVAGGQQIQARMRGAAARVPARGAGAPRFAVNAAWLVALLLLGSPALTAGLDPSAQAFARDLRLDKLNRADADLMHRGYYENLTGVNQYNSRLWEVYAKRPENWLRIWTSEAVREVDDFVRWEVVPLVGINLNGTTLRTNRWGMRDRDYELHPPPGTFRIAMTGASFVMGDGVNDHEVFEQIVEDRINASQTEPAGRVEILNFGAPAFSPVQQLLLLQRSILDFRPDVLFMVGHETDMHNSARHTSRMFRNGVTIPYPFLDSMLVEAGVTRDLTLDEATERLHRPPFGREIVRWSLEQIAATCLAHGITPVWIYARTPSHDLTAEELSFLKRTAANAGFTVMDISDAYGDVDDAELRVAAWDGHPNARAHRMLADRLYRALIDEGMLARMRAGASAGVTR